MTYDCSPRESRRTMCIINSRKSWSSLTVDWQSSSNRDSHILFNVVVSSFVESLDEHLVMLEYSSSDLLIELWDEADLLNDLKRDKACFRWLSDIQSEHIDWFRIEIWLKKRLCSWDEGKKYIRCDMLNKKNVTVNKWRRTVCCTTREDEKWGGRSDFERTVSLHLRIFRLIEVVIRYCERCSSLFAEKLSNKSEQQHSLSTSRETRRN